jgi:hypothetical protein
MSQIINGRIFHGPMYGDGPEAPVIPTKPGLILGYEISKVDGEWTCSVQLHGNPSKEDMAEAFKIVLESASKHSAEMATPIQETVTS